MSFELPPLVKCAERVMLEIEQAVRGFPRYHKYTHGTRLRDQAMDVAQLSHRAWRDRRRQTEWTAKLIFAIDDLKLSLQLGAQIRAFGSFGQFEALAFLAVETRESYVINGADDTSIVLSAEDVEALYQWWKAKRKA